MDAITNPRISNFVRVSFINTKAITAETGGTKKNKVEVLLTDLFLIKYIKIANAPKEIKKIW